MGAAGFEPTSLLGRRRYSIPVRLTYSATSPVWAANAWMDGQNGGGGSRKAFALRSRPPGPAAALGRAGRGPGRVCRGMHGMDFQGTGCAYVRVRRTSPP